MFPTTYLQCLAVALLVPAAISVYELLRKPTWSGETRMPWWLINLLSMLAGIISSAAACAIMFRRGATDIWTILYIAEIMAVLGWMTVSCSITDFDVRKIDRHMLRPVYAIQTIISMAWMIRAFGFGWKLLLMAAMMLVLMVIFLVCGYIPALKFGPSDARCMACMEAACTPLLGVSVLWPNVAAILLIFITGQVIFTMERNKAKDAVISYDATGKPKVRDRKVKHQPRMINGEIHTPAGHAMTIPFLVGMFVWLLA